MISSLLLAACTVAAIAVQAQPPQGPPPGGGPGGPHDMEPLTLTTHQLSPSVYWVEGGIGNTGFIVGENGVIVIDTTMTVAGGKQLQAEVAKVTSKPVKTVILTHGDMDHIGGLSSFPAGIQVIAQTNNKNSMAAAITSGHSRLLPAQLPNHTVDLHEAIQIEGVQLELLHWAPAHTSGDLVVFLPQQKIVFTGDIIVLDQPRALIHPEQQGSSEGWVQTARGVSTLDADRFVVGHGDVQSKAQIQARVNLVAGERETILKLFAQGESLAKIQAAVGDPPPSDNQPGAPGGPHFEPFSQVVYEELTKKK